MLKQKIKTEELEIGNLVYYGVFDKPKVAIIVKAKKLLKLYDIFKNFQQKKYRHNLKNFFL